MARAWSLHTAPANLYSWACPWSSLLQTFLGTSDPESSNLSQDCWHQWKVHSPHWWTSECYRGGSCHFRRAGIGITTSDVMVEFIVKFDSLMKICSFHGCLYQVAMEGPAWPADMEDIVMLPNQGEDSMPGGWPFLGNVLKFSYGVLELFWTQTCLLIDWVNVNSEKVGHGKCCVTFFGLTPKPISYM